MGLLSRKPPLTDGSDCHIYVEETEWEGESEEGDPLLFRGLGILDAEDGSTVSWDEVNESDFARVLHVAGVTHHKAALHDPAFNPGSFLLLMREPDNPYDQNAVKVFDLSGHHDLGYVPKEEAALMKQWLDVWHSPPLYPQVLSLIEVISRGQRVALRILVTKPKVEIGRVDDWETAFGGQQQ